MNILKILKKSSGIYGAPRGPVKGTEVYERWLPKFKESLARRGFTGEKIKQELASTHDKLGMLQKEVLKIDLNPNLTKEEKLGRKMQIYKQGQKIGRRFRTLSDAWPEIAATVSRSYQPSQKVPKQQKPLQEQGQ